MRIVPASVRTSVRGRLPASALGALDRVRGRKSPPPSDLFGGDDALFKELISSARVYGEYGMGKSTAYALEHTRCTVLAVETSLPYVQQLTDSFRDNPRLRAQHIDVGPVGDWGRPMSYAKRGVFPSYASSIWEQGVVPDLVLIDGRFRVLCFLTSLLRAHPGTRILFDDYAHREHYHVIEELIDPTDRCGRQALFVVPDNFARAEAESLAERFTLVWD